MAQPRTLPTLEARTTGSFQGWSNPCEAPTITKGKATIRVSHVMAPNCWWSWGYYGTLARVRLVYGNQVDLRLGLSPVYTDLDHWLEHNGLDRAGWQKWAEQSARKMGVPVFTEYSKIKLAKDSSPAVLASIAAFRQGEPKGERFVRALLRRAIVEGADVTPRAVLADAAREAGLDAAAFERDLKDEPGLRREVEERNAALPGDVQLGFYNIVVEDDRGRKVVIDHAYEPAEVIDAIEFLSAGRLQKNQPTDPVAFLRATGPAATVEVARAFAWTPEDANRKLTELARGGQLKRITLAGGDHWIV